MRCIAKFCSFVCFNSIQEFAQVFSVFSAFSPIDIMNFTIIRKILLFPKIKCTFLSQSFSTGYIPPGNPGENFFERANPSHPGNFFCLIPCPGAKNDGRIPPGWGKIFPNSKKLLRIKLAKVL